MMCINAVETHRNKEFPDDSIDLNNIDGNRK